VVSASLFHDYPSKHYDLKKGGAATEKNKKAVSGAQYSRFSALSHTWPSKIYKR